MKKHAAEHPLPGPFQISPLVPSDSVRMVGMASGREIVLCPLLEVGYFEALGKYTRVVFGVNSGLLSLGISAVLTQLPLDRFRQVHRSFIVNIPKVQRARRDEFGRMWLAVAGCTDDVVVSRSYEHLFRAGIF